MKKFLLVIFIGMVLALNLYGLINDLVESFEKEDDTSDIGTVVYIVE